jgi:hypothetical protein
MGRNCFRAQISLNEGRENGKGFLKVSFDWEHRKKWLMFLPHGGIRKSIARLEGE